LRLCYLIDSSSSNFDTERDKECAAIVHPTTDPVVIIGAGMAGLTAAADLAVAGRAVLVLERGTAPGGKLRTVVSFP